MTLPLFMYNEVIGQLNFSAGALASIVLIVPAIIACLFDIITKDMANGNTVVKAVPNEINKTRDIITYIICSVSFLLIAIPIILYSIIGLFKKYPSDLTLSFVNISKLWDMGLGAQSHTGRPHLPGSCAQPGECPAAQR